MTPPPFQITRLAVALTAACVTYGLAGEFTGLAWNDAIWYTHIAARVLDGERLYRDVIDINPPLIIWLKVPVVWLARVAATDPVTVWRVAVALGLGTSALITARLLRSMWALPWLAFILFVLPGRRVFGEREHLILAALLPWLAVAARRLRGEPAPGWPGLAAALAFALKPYFLPLWPLLVWLEGRRLGWPRVVRLPEHWSTAGGLVLFGLAVLLLTPEYVALVRAYGDLYGDYRRVSTLALFAVPSVALASLALASYLLVRSRLAHRPCPDLLALAVAASGAAVLLQGKGFWYHYYPLLAFGILLLAALDARATRVVVGLVAVAVFALRLPEAAGSRLSDEVRDLAILRALRAQPAPSSLTVIDPTGSLTPFRYAYYAGIPWSPRWPFLWPATMPPTPQADSLIARELTRIANEPGDLLLLRAADAPGSSPTMVAFPTHLATRLAAFPAFRAILRRYVEVSPVGHYRVFRLVRAP